jgi:hypothetical protein
MSPVKYELGFYIPEDDILHSQCRQNNTLCRGCIRVGITTQETPERSNGDILSNTQRVRWKPASESNEHLRP